MTPEGMRTSEPIKEEESLRRTHDCIEYVTDGDFGRMDEAVMDVCAAIRLLRIDNNSLIIEVDRLKAFEKRAHDRGWGNQSEHAYHNGFEAGRVLRRESENTIRDNERRANAKLVPLACPADGDIGSDGIHYRGGGDRTYECECSAIADAIRARVKEETL